MEHQLQSEADLAEEKIQNIENALEDEKRKKEECEQAIHQHVQVDLEWISVFKKLYPSHFTR
mgnify:CR=1 FL=1